MDSRRKWRFSAVLGDEVYQTIETVQVYCAEILDKKCTSSIVKKLNAVCPLPELVHLKRVKAQHNTLSVLLLPYKGDGDPDQGKSEVQTSVIECHALVGIGEISIASVAKQKPITREQYEEASAHWPTHFHEDKRLEKTLKGEIFTASELSDIQTYMSIGLEEAKAAAEPSVGAVVVDPVTGRVIAQAHTDTDHPTRHAVMVCIDRVASEQGGGVWCQDKRKMENTVVPTLPLDEASSPTDDPVPPAKRYKLNTQYLCTGYDAYITLEPCVMCAMALLHSRVGRVFYCHRNPFCGALGSKYKLHIQRGLNHHFEVYEGARTE